MKNDAVYMITFLKIALVTAVAGLFQPLYADCVFEKTLSGEEVNIGILLSWSTISESDNALFIIEKSRDGVNFEEVNSLKGAGNSTGTRQYSFLDIMAHEGNLFYRLKQVDSFGTFQVTEPVEVKKEIENYFMVADMSSELTSRNFDFQVDAFAEKELICQVKDSRGNIVNEQKLSLINGLNNVSVDLADQPEGLYKIVLKAGEEEEVLVVKRVLDEIESASSVATNRKTDKRKN